MADNKMVVISKETARTLKEKFGAVVMDDSILEVVIGKALSEGVMKCTMETITKTESLNCGFDAKAPKGAKLSEEEAFFQFAVNAKEFLNVLNNLTILDSDLVLADGEVTISLTVPGIAAIPVAKQAALDDEDSIKLKNALRFNRNKMLFRAQFKTENLIDGIKRTIEYAGGRFESITFRYEEGNKLDVFSMNGRVISHIRAEAESVNAEKAFVDAGEPYYFGITLKHAKSLIKILGEAVSCIFLVSDTQVCIGLSETSTVYTFGLCSEGGGASLAPFAKKVGEMENGDVEAQAVVDACELKTALSILKGVSGKKIMTRFRLKKGVLELKTNTAAVMQVKVSAQSGSEECDYILNLPDALSVAGKDEGNLVISFVDSSNYMPALFRMGDLENVSDNIYTLSPFKTEQFEKDGVEEKKEDKKA